MRKITIKFSVNEDGYSEEEISDALLAIDIVDCLVEQGWHIGGEVVNDSEAEKPEKK